MSETIQAAATPQPAAGFIAEQANPAAATPETKAASTVEQPQNPAPAPDADTAKQFAALSKRQKELFLREQELNSRLNKLKEQEEIEALREANPLEYIKKKGLKFEDLMQKALKDGEEPTTEEKLAAIQKRLDDELKAREDEKKKQLEDAEKAKKDAEQKFIDDYKKKIETDIKAEADKYELINTQNAFGLVFSVIEENWEKNREVMSIQDAADKVEDYLLVEAKKLLALKKLGISSAKPDPEAQIHTKTEMPTLNSSTTPSTTTRTDKYLSDEESLAEAAKLLKWN